MLLIACHDEPCLRLMGLIAYEEGNTIVCARGYGEASAYLEQDSIVVRYQREGGNAGLRPVERERSERCSVTAAIVMLGFVDGWRLCCRLHASRERIPALWIVPQTGAGRAFELTRAKEHAVLVEPIDLCTVYAWLDHVRRPRIACEAGRRARELGLTAPETAILARRALHRRHISMCELARELDMKEPTLRSRCLAIQRRAKLTIDRLAADVRRHIGDREVSSCG